MRHLGLIRGFILGFGLAAVAVCFSGRLNAQTLTLNQLKSKVFDAKIVEKTFAKGLHHCNELDGKNFYFAARDRVLNLDDYDRSLQNLVKDRAFNPERKRPWNPEDAKARMDLVQKQAHEDKANCELMANRASYEKQLNELEKK